MKLNTSSVNMLMQVIGARRASEYFSERGLTRAGSGGRSRGRG